MSYRNAIRLTPEQIIEARNARAAKQSASAKRSEFFRSRAQVTTPVQDSCNMIFGTTGAWTAEYSDFAARIAAAADSDMVKSIAAQWIRTHHVSIAQAGVLGRFATANNINL